ncbi:MAG: hypothetical protein GEU73_09850 [Chloroflexi bacterium]|nr:hypothetical protein [Chloroflexota bacterium]
MPFCPRCRVEYRVEVVRCPECGERLVDTPSPRAAEPESRDVREVRLTTFSTVMEAQMWAELLEAEGIPTVLVPLGPAPYLGVGTPHEIRVRSDDLERARRVLAETGG